MARVVCVWLPSWPTDRLRRRPGVVIDVTGAAHLQGGERPLLADLAARLTAAGLTAKAALADTWAAAWGLARFAATGTVAPPGGGFAALASLPVEALRLEPATAAALHRLGLDTVGELAGAHRPSLGLRFGRSLARRLDQVRGSAPEPITPVRPPEMPQAHLAFAEPLPHLTGLALALRRLAEGLGAELERRDLVARRLDLLLTRVDGAVEALRIGSARGTGDPAHIVRLFGERLQTVDPGFGVEAMSLRATRAEPLQTRQLVVRGEAEPPDPDLGPLLDRIASRIGIRRLYRVAPVESDLPERSWRRVPPLSPPLGLGWHDGPRPVLLLELPEPVEVIALLPDHPPRLLVWRGQRIPVACADGPERVHGEWWREAGELWLTRDYYRVEGADGCRCWLFGVPPPSARVADETDAGGALWYLHGVFG